MSRQTRLLRGALEWLGLVGLGHRQGHSHPPGTGRPHAGVHRHTHGVVDPTIATTTRGIWAIKWSFVILGITAALQLVVVFLTNSVALLADTIHNFGDAGTAVPLWIAFMLARKRPSARFTYGYGRVEDLAGVLVVLIILFSAIVAGYQAVDRLIRPQPIEFLAWVAAAGILGFAGNEAVAIFRIRVGRQINSVALVADGYHARTDGLTSLAVVLGALGVWLGFPLADPIVGLIITAMILGIVWQSGKAVLARMLDGVDPEVAVEIRHAAEHVPSIKRISSLRVRWIGHRLHAEAGIVVDDATTVGDGRSIAKRFREIAMDHLPALAAVRVEFADDDGEGPKLEHRRAFDESREHGHGAGAHRHEH